MKKNLVHVNILMSFMLSYTLKLYVGHLNMIVV